MFLPFQSAHCVYIIYNPVGQFPNFQVAAQWAGVRPNAYLGATERNWQIEEDFLADGIGFKPDLCIHHSSWVYNRPTLNDVGLTNRWDIALLRIPQYYYDFNWTPNPIPNPPHEVTVNQNNQQVNIWPVNTACLPLRERGAKTNENIGRWWEMAGFGFLQVTQPGDPPGAPTLQLHHGRFQYRGTQACVTHNPANPQNPAPIVDRDGVLIHPWADGEVMQGGGDSGGPLTREALINDEIKMELVGLTNGFNTYFLPNGTPYYCFAALDLGHGPVYDWIQGNIDAWTHVQLHQLPWFPQPPGSEYHGQGG